MIADITITAEIVATLRTDDLVTATRHTIHHRAETFVPPHITRFITTLVTRFDAMDSTIRRTGVVRVTRSKHSMRGQYRSTRDHGIQIGAAFRH